MLLSYPSGRASARTFAVAATSVVLAFARPATAQEPAGLIAVCPEAAAWAPLIDQTVHETLAREASGENAAVLAEWTFAFAPCSTTSGSLAATSGGYAFARRVTFALGTSSPTRMSIDAAVTALVRQILALRGLASVNASGETATALAVPPRSPGRAAAPVATATGEPVATAPIDAEPTTLPEDPRSERFAVAVDGGLRLYQGSTGAFGLRIRIGLKWFYFDYRFATVSVAGVFEGDTARILEQSYGIGLRYRAAIGRRSSLSVGAALYLGAATGQGNSDAGGSSSFTTGCFDVLLGAVYEAGFGAMRLRVGVDLGLARSAVVLGTDEVGDRHRLGGFDGLEFGLYAGVGLARLRGRAGR